MDKAYIRDTIVEKLADYFDMKSADIQGHTRILDLGDELDYTGLIVELEVGFECAGAPTITMPEQVEEVLYEKNVTIDEFIETFSAQIPQNSIA